MKIDLTSRFETRERIEHADRKCMERYGFQSSRDSKSNQTVCCKIKNGQKMRSVYQNDLWIRFIRTLIFFDQFQVFDTASCNF